jgi:hypothetical protein
MNRVPGATLANPDGRMPATTMDKGLRVPCQGNPSQIEAIEVTGRSGICEHHPDITPALEKGSSIINRCGLYHIETLCLEGIPRPRHQKGFAFQRAIKRRPKPNPDFQIEASVPHDHRD